MACVNSNIKQGEFAQSFEDRRNHVRVEVSLDTKLQYGNCYNLENVESIINKNYNHSSFDYRQYMKSKMIVYNAESSGFKYQKQNIMTRIKNYRQRMIESNKSKLGEASAYVNAILLGENDIDSYYKVLYGQTGISPLFAISGMHIGLIYGGLMYVLSRLRVIDNTANKFIIAILSIYSVLAGSSVAVNRALMMIVLKTIFGLKSKTTIVLSAAISLMYNPFNALNQGYYLSYLITYAIITMPTKLYQNQKFSVVKLSYLIYLISLPLSYNFNYTFNIFSPLSLLIITPFISFGLMPLALIYTIFPSEIYFGLIVVLVNGINKYVEFVNRFTITSGHISVIMWIIYFAILYVILRKVKIKSGILLLALWFILISLDIELYPQITFVDVGQGDGALLEYSGKNILFDVGNSPVNMRQELRYQGVSKIDALFISHAHLDHYGSLEELEKYFPINAVYEVAGNQIINGSVGLSNAYQDDNFTIIPYYGTNPNDRELVVRVDFGDISVLFPGDIEAESEKYLVDNYCSEINSDIIKVPHHGSRTSSSQAFLNCVSPSVAVISSGINNRYGHPNKEIVERYQQLGALYDTQFDGEVTITVKGRRLDIKKVR